MNCKICGVRYESSQVEGTCDLCLPKSADRTIERWKQRAVDAEAKLKRYESVMEEIFCDVLLAISKLEDEHTVAGALLVLHSTAERVRDFKLE